MDIEGKSESVLRSVGFIESVESESESVGIG